jgi:hypothetical protein
VDFRTLTDFDEVDAGASQAWFGLWCGHARRIADFAPCGRRWILGRLPISMKSTLVHRRRGLVFGVDMRAG